MPITCAAKRALGVGRLDHVAEADAHVEDLEHLAVVDLGVALDEGENGMRLDEPVDLVADRGGHLEDPIVDCGEDQEEPEVPIKVCNRRAGPRANRTSAGLPEFRKRDLSPREEHSDRP